MILPVVVMVIVAGLRLFALGPAFPGRETATAFRPPVVVRTFAGRSSLEIVRFFLSCLAIVDLVIAAAGLSAVVVPGSAVAAGPAATVDPGSFAVGSAIVDLVASFVSRRERVQPFAVVQDHQGTYPNHLTQLLWPRRRGRKYILERRDARSPQPFARTAKPE